MGASWVRRCAALRAARVAIAAALVALLPAPVRAEADGPTRQAERIVNLARARFGSLSAAELAVVRSAPRRELAWVGPDSNPDNPANDATHGDQWGAERSVRASLLRWVYTDPEVRGLVDPSGLGIAGARIIGPLDLSYVKAETPITLVRCYIPDGIDLTFSHLQSFEIRASSTGPISADQSELAGDLAVRFGTYGPLSLFRSRIGGNLDCTGATVLGNVDETVNAVESRIAGDAVFHDGFTTDGVVDFRLARVGQSLSFHGALFSGMADTGLNAERAVIGGTLYWVDIRHTPRTQLDLENAKADALWDDESSWPAPGMLTIDGFVYSEFAGGPGDADARLRWLALQPPGYRPQPYRQVATVLRESGRETGATDVLIAKEEALRRDGGLGHLERAWNRMLDVTIGYGYRPLRALWWMAGFVVIGTVLFGLGYLAGIVTPTDAAAYRSFVESGTVPPHYPSFNAFVYSLENFLPVVALYECEYWRPNPVHDATGQPRSRAAGAVLGRHGGTLLRWYLWFHILAGWTLAPLFFAGLSGLVRPA
jgi:hypothetical protein